MAKNWYPVVNPEKCTKCGVCVNVCRNGVYDKRKSPIPMIVKNVGCIQGCHGCGNRCPYGAITYFGKNTDWTPPGGKKGCA